MCLHGRVFFIKMLDAQSSMRNAQRRKQMKGRFRSLIATTVVGAGVIWVAGIVVGAGQRDPTAAGPLPETLQQQEDAQRRTVAIDNDDIGGVVRSAKGPEA